MRRRCAEVIWQKERPVLGGEFGANFGKARSIAGYFESANGTPGLPKIPYGLPLRPVRACNVHSRRLEDHIKDLCAKIIAAPESELEPVLSELKSALHDHSIKLRRLAAEKLTGVEPPPSDRRKQE